MSQKSLEVMYMGHTVSLNNHDVGMTVNHTKVEMLWDAFAMILEWTCIYQIILDVLHHLHRTYQIAKDKKRNTEVIFYNVLLHNKCSMII